MQPPTCPNPFFRHFIVSIRISFVNAFQIVIRFHFFSPSKLCIVIGHPGILYKAADKAVHPPYFGNLPVGSKEAIVIFIIIAHGNFAQ